MAKPISATPVARGEDARRIDVQMRSERPLSAERTKAIHDSVKSARSTFAFVKEPTGRAKP